MKIYIHLILLAFSLLISYSATTQFPDCLTARAYEAVFKDIGLPVRKAAAIEIGYTPDEYSIGLIKQMKLLNPDELEAFNEAVDETDYLSCAKFRRKVELLQDKNLIKENGQYYVFYFSKIISLSDTRKCILFHNGVRSTKYKGGKAVGGEILYVLEKENDSWIIKEKKPIVTY